MASQRVGLLMPLVVDPMASPGSRPVDLPRKDYHELARLVDGEIIDLRRIAADPLPIPAALTHRLGAASRHALWAYNNRDRYDIFYSESERVGLPLAALLKAVPLRPRHVVLSHWLSPRKKNVLLRTLRLYSRIDQFICHVEAQRQVAMRAGVPPSKVTTIPYGVDERFWQPSQEPTDDLFCAVGMEHRDYPTLLSAMHGTTIRLIIAAASPWFNRSGVDKSQLLPSNVKVSRYDLRGMRELYAESRFVVVPLQNVDFQAGITTILEAMASGKAVIATATRGLVGAHVVVPGETGLLVPPGDPQALREAIAFLWSNPNEARRMGIAGRQLVEQSFTLDRFTQAVAVIILSGSATAVSR
jgi:glycosyltransferase involved in cell wall biosynthesis